MRLAGYLVCANAEEAEVVTEHLPRHVELTLAEPGCLSFDVERTPDPLVWRVTERFRNRAAFTAHQQRVSQSEWGRITAGIKREYEISEVPDEPHGDPR